MTTESDRELLELAAKAAGIEGRYESWTGQGFMEGIRQKNFEEKCFRVWNPLIYDDHALRLAARLKLNIMQGDFSVGVNNEDDIDECALVRDEGERLAVLRRAITRAAASIGRGEG